MGGQTRYVHHISVEDFKISKLWYAVHCMRDLNVPMPNWAWFSVVGRMFPDNLRVLENDEDLQNMWKESGERNRLVIEVFMQDCICEESPGDDGEMVLSYYLPAGMPMPRFDNDGNLPEEYVEDWKRRIKPEHAAQIEMLEYKCDRWYTSAIHYPRGFVSFIHH